MDRLNWILVGVFFAGVIATGVLLADSIHGIEQYQTALHGIMNQGNA